MKFVCDVKELNNALSIAIHAIPIKTPKPILEGLLVETARDHIVITSTDMAIGIECKVNATIEEEGSVVLPGRFFCDVARKLPDDNVEISVNSRFIAKVTSGSFKTNLPGTDGIEFPELPNVKGMSFEIEQKKLKHMIDGTLFSVAVDESRPILTGSLFEVNQDTINIVALDGFRLALCRDNVAGPEGDIEAVIGGKMVGDISKILSDSDSMVKVTISKSHACFEIDNSRVVTRLLEGEFMRYKSILPQDYMTKVRVNRARLADAIDRASLISRATKASLVCFKINDGTLTVYLQNGNMEEAMDILFEGKELDIAFNIKYILDVLRSIDDNEVEIRFKSNVNPCVFYPVEGDSYLYLVLPVRV